MNRTGSFLVQPITCAPGAFHLTRVVATALAAGYVLLLLASIPAIGQTRIEGGDLYLLAGTPNLDGIPSYAVSLYTVNSDQTLKLVREIAPGDTIPFSGTGGCFAIRDDMGDKIYVVYPGIIPTTISVIHKDRPTWKDEVDFNPRHQVVLQTDFGVAAASGRQSYLLCTLLGGEPNTEATDHGGSLISVAGDAAASGTRIRRNDWSMYSSFRYQGTPGGPLPGFDTLGYVKDKQIRVRAQAGPGPYTAKIDLNSAPPFPIEGTPEDTVVIAAATARYFAFFPLVRLPRDPAVAVAHSSVLIDDRTLNTWKEISYPTTVAGAQAIIGSWPSGATADTRRIFGPWLASRVEIQRPQGEVRNPGHENERAYVRQLYERGIWRHKFVPGTLLLDNLEDGRRVVLNTGQEDSEILDVRSNGLALYRVNDSIFTAQIEGDRLGKPALVVKDEDVPEVHWVFWSFPKSHPQH
jgi:hypothetical protein